MIILVKKLNDEVLNFVNGGLFTNPKRLEEKKLKRFEKEQNDEKNKLKDQKFK